METDLVLFQVSFLMLCVCHLLTARGPTLVQWVWYALLRGNAQCVAGSGLEQPLDGGGS